MGKGELMFVDDRGGALASLAASIAAARGAPARAATTAPARTFPEVATVLAEIGITQLVSAQQGMDGADHERIVIGSSPIAGGAPAIDVRLYEGPDKTAFGDAGLQRLALARIARDRVERWLEQR